MYHYLYCTYVKAVSIIFAFLEGDFLSIYSQNLYHKIISAMSKNKNSYICRLKIFLPTELAKRIKYHLKFKYLLRNKYTKTTINWVI